ncbi:MAG: hypothetical protein ACK4P4_02800 [Allorhizobium sp.]
MSDDRDKIVAEVVAEVSHHAEGADGLVGVLYDAGVTDAHELVELVLAGEARLSSKAWREIDGK